jgi:hypothetical protein
VGTRDIALAEQLEDHGMVLELCADDAKPAMIALATTIAAQVDKQ